MRALLRLRLVQLGLGGLQRAFAPLEFGAADEALILEGDKAFEVGGGQVTLRGGGRDLRARGGVGQLVVLGIELCE